jgi:hypothetical protein
MDSRDQEASFNGHEKRQQRLAHVQNDKLSRDAGRF